MKFAMKSLAAAAAIAAAGIANAAPVTGGLNQPITVTGNGKTTAITLKAGSGALAFSAGSGFDGVDPNTLGGLIGALNVGQVAITGVGGATVQESFVPDEVGELIRSGSTANAGVVALTADTTTGQILSVQSTGGANQLGTRISGTLTGGSASVTNLRFDLANKVVYADLAGTKAAVGTTPAVSYNLPGTALWTIGNVTGPTVLPPTVLLGTETNIRSGMEAAGFTFVSVTNGLYTFNATNVISGLKVTTAGFDFFKNSLGLLSTGVNALNAVNNDAQGWGQVTSNLTFTVQQVPEPSTYALMGLGLVGIGFAARRRAK